MDHWITFSPDGSKLACYSSESTVKLWDALTGQEQCTLRGHSGVVWCCAFNHDGSKLASCSEDCSIVIWDAQSSTQRFVLKDHTHRAEGCAFALSPSRYIK